MALKVGELFALLRLETGQFYQHLDETRNKLGMTQDQMEALKGRAITGLGVGLAGLGAASFKFGNALNKSMANVQTLIPESKERVKELKAEVQSLAIATGKGTTDIADGLYQVISAFGDSADTAKILEINAKAATAGVATTLDAINLTSAVTKGYGDTTAEAVQKVSDLAFNAVKLGQTTFPELASSIGRVTPLAAALGVSMEELFGVMATGTGVTGTAAEVSTQLRGILQSLSAPTKDMAALIAQLGFENGEAMIKQMGLKDTIGAITKAAEESGKPLQAYISSIEGQTLAMALSGPQADAFAEKLKAMGDVSGSTEEAFDAQTKGINRMGFAWEQAKVRFEVALQKFSGISPALMGIGTLITITQQLKGMGIHLKAIPKLARLSFAALRTGAITTSGTFTVLGTTARAAWAAVLGPIGWIIAGIALVIGAVVLMIKHWDKLKAVFKTVYDAVKKWLVDGMKRFVQVIKDLVRQYLAPFMWLYEKLVGHSVIPDMVNGIEDHMLRLKGPAMVEPALDAVQETSRAFAGLNGKTAVSSLSVPLKPTLRSTAGAASQAAVRSYGNPSPEVVNLLRRMVSLQEEVVKLMRQGGKLVLA